MIQLTENIWIGDSKDETNSGAMTAILNVAIDLRRTNKGPIVYAQCGLIDGPGNNLNTYRAAIFMLTALVEDGHKVLVCCHEGGRALAIVLMHMHNLTGISYNELLNIISERINVPLPHVHEAHRNAFKELA